MAAKDVSWERCEEEEVMAEKRQGKPKPPKVKPSPFERKTTKRSPNYPAISLPAAIERARPLYEVERHAGAPLSVALRHLGFRSLNGISRTYLSALKKFGLIDVGANRVTATSSAADIIE